MIFNYKIYFFMFSIWIWVFSFLYYFNIIPYSLLYSSFFGLIFTFYNQILVVNKTDFIKKIFWLTIEFFVFFINYRKHIVINKKPIISFIDIIFNIILFLVYLLFLKFNNKSFYNLYFIRFRKK